VNEIVSLAVRYGIVTPYTSFLIDERSDVLTQSGRNSAASSAASSFAPAAMPTSGAKAVDQSQLQNEMRGAGVAPAAPTKVPAPMVSGAPASSSAPSAYNETQVIQYVGDKTFISRNSVWTDTQFDPSKMTTTEIEFGSEAYFNMLANNSQIGKYVALSSRVIFVLNGTAYEITDNGSGSTAPSAAPTAAPATATPQVTARSSSQVTSSTQSTSAAKSSGSTSTLPSAANPFCGGLLAAIGMTLFLWLRLR
jgi:Ca-activated chloride channel family protein